MRMHDPISPDQFASLPVQIRQEVELDCTPQALFAIFDDVVAWTRWLGITVDWHDKPPYAAGMSRTITTGPVRALERFTIYENGSRMAFFFERSTLWMVRAFAEDWRVEPIGADRCRLVWRVAIAMRWPFAPFGFLVRLGMIRMGRRGLPVLSEMASQRADQTRAAMAEKASVKKPESMPDATSSGTPSGK